MEHLHLSCIPSGDIPPGIPPREAAPFNAGVAFALALLLLLTYLEEDFLVALHMLC